MNCRVRNNPGPRFEPYLRFPHLQSADRQQTDWPGILYYPSYCRVYHLAYLGWIYLYGNCVSSCNADI